MNYFITTLFCLVFCSGETKINNSIPPDIKIALISKESNLYQVTLYNKNDSVLCFLSSAFAKYRKDACDTLVASNYKTYYLNYSFTDSKFDVTIPLQRKLCILPHQELNFIVRFEELKPNSSLQLQYFYSNDYSLSNDKKETKKPLWYKKYNWKLSDNQIPF